MAYNPFDPSSRYRLPSWNLDNPLSAPQSGLGGALSTQQPTGITGNTFMGTGTTSYSRTPPRTTTDVNIMTTPPTTPTSPLPGLPGDTATGGSVNPTTGLWEERNQTAGNMNPPLTPVNTPTLTPEQRAARYAMESGQAANQRDSLGRATSLQSIMGSAPLPGGGGVQSPMGSAPGSTSTSYPPTGPGTSPSVDARMTRLDEGLTLPKQSITPEDVMVDPGFKWQQEQLGRRLEDIFAAKGRVGSTDYFNALTNANQKLLSDEYNRINNQQWERGMEMNRLLYDRRAQENITNYEREFRENERLYGRQQAENILAYERAFREDARDYERLRYLVQLGFGATQASTGT